MDMVGTCLKRTFFFFFMEIASVMKPAIKKTATNTSTTVTVTITPTIMDVLPVSDVVKDSN